MVKWRSNSTLNLACRNLWLKSEKVSLLLAVSVSFSLVCFRYFEIVSTSAKISLLSLFQFGQLECCNAFRKSHSIYVNKTKEVYNVWSDHFFSRKQFPFLRFRGFMHPASLINLGNKLEHALLKIWIVEGKRFGA